MTARTHLCLPRALPRPWLHPRFRGCADVQHSRRNAAAGHPSQGVISPHASQRDPGGCASGRAAGL